MEGNTMKNKTLYIIIAAITILAITTMSACQNSLNKTQTDSLLNNNSNNNSNDTGLTDGEDSLVILDNVSYEQAERLFIEDEKELTLTFTLEDQAKDYLKISEGVVTLNALLNLKENKFDLQVCELLGEHFDLDKIEDIENIDKLIEEYFALAEEADVEKGIEIELGGETITTDRTAVAVPNTNATVTAYVYGTKIVKRTVEFTESGNRVVIDITDNDGSLSGEVFVGGIKFASF